jgi:Lon protease-like protein
MTQEDIIAVFPLPNVVFFPKTNLPLHVFEPRYRQMVNDTMENKQLIGMYLLQPGYQEDYYGNPPVYPIGCAGELVHTELLPEGKFNIVLHGLYRARALETVQEYPYRRARVQVLPEWLEARPRTIRKLKNSLMTDYLQLAGDDADSALHRVRDLSEMVNLLATVVQFDVEEKMKMLEENDVCLRAELLQSYMRRHVSTFRMLRSFGHLRSSNPEFN